jgi:hypothetical protein
MRLHVLLLQLRQELLVLRRLRALQPLLPIDGQFFKSFGHAAVGEVFEKGVGVEEVGLEEVELGSEAFCVGEVGGVVVEEFDGALLQVLRLADLEADLLKLLLEVL